MEIKITTKNGEVLAVPFLEDFDIHKKFDWDILTNILFREIIFAKRREFFERDKLVCPFCGYHHDRLTFIDVEAAEVNYPYSFYCRSCHERLKISNMEVTLIYQQRQSRLEWNLQPYKAEAAGKRGGK